MQEKPRLMLLITKSNFGGAQKYVLDLATSEKIQNEFDVCVAVGGNGELIDRLIEKKIRIIKLQHLANSLNPIKALRMLRELDSVLKKERTDILHINSSVAGVIGTIIGKINKTKIVFTAHGWPFNETRPGWQIRLFKILMSFVVRRSHINIAVSKQIIQDAEIKNHNKFELVYLGIKDIEFVDFEKLDKNKINILSIGELHPSKNHGLAIRALKNIENNNVVYHIFGGGTERENLEKLISDLGLQEKVILHGNIKNASIYINSFDIFLMPSRTEALGYALLEASQANPEILVSNAGGMKEVIEKIKRGKTFETENQKDLEEKLKEILEQIRDKKNKDGASRYPNKFSVDEMVTNTIRIYKNLL